MRGDTRRVGPFISLLMTAVSMILLMVTTLLPLFLDLPMTALHWTLFTIAVVLFVVAVAMAVHYRPGGGRASEPPESRS